MALETDTDQTLRHVRTDHMEAVRGCSPVHTLHILYYVQEENASNIETTCIFQNKPVYRISIPLLICISIRFGESLARFGSLPMPGKATNC